MKKQTNEMPALASPCPVTETDQAVFARVMRSLFGKWKPAILLTLLGGKRRFGELRRGISGITQHMLTAQLRELEADGLVRRTAYAEIPPRVEYEATDAALALAPVFDAFMVWFHAHGVRPTAATPA